MEFIVYLHFSGYGNDLVHMQRWHCTASTGQQRFNELSSPPLVTDLLRILRAENVDSFYSFQLRGSKRCQHASFMYKIPKPDQQTSITMALPLLYKIEILLKLFKNRCFGHFTILEFFHNPNSKLVTKRKNFTFFPVPVNRLRKLQVRSC